MQTKRFMFDWPENDSVMMRSLCRRCSDEHYAVMVGDKRERLLGGHNMMDVVRADLFFVC